MKKEKELERIRKHFIESPSQPRTSAFLTGTMHWGAATPFTYNFIQESPILECQALALGQG